MSDKEIYFNEIKNRFHQFGFCREVAAFIAAQSCLVTDYGRSLVYKANHNCFGMKLPTNRVHLAVNEFRSYAVYYNEHYSALDYILWMSFNKFPYEVMEDLELFKNHLAKSLFNPYSDYISRINTIYLQFNY